MTDVRIDGVPHKPVLGSSSDGISSDRLRTIVQPGSTGQLWMMSFLIVVGVGGRPAGSGRVCPAGLPAYPRGPWSWAVWGWGSGEHRDGVDAAAAPGQRCLPGPVLG